MAPRTDNGSVAKDIVTGTAITLSIFAVTSYLPILGFFCALFIPLPTLFYRSKLGRNTGAIVPAAALFVMAAVLGGIAVDLVFERPISLGHLLAAEDEAGRDRTREEILDKVVLAPYLETQLDGEGSVSAPAFALD